MSDQKKPHAAQVAELQEEIARLRRGLEMIARHESFAAVVARRVLRNDGTYK